MVLEFREGLQSLQLAHRNWFDFCDLFCCDFNCVLPVCAGQRTTYSIAIPLFCDLSYWDKNECCPRYCYVVVKTSCLTAEANSCPPFPVLEDMPLLTQLLWTSSPNSHLCWDPNSFIHQHIIVKDSGWWSPG